MISFKLGLLENQHWKDFNCPENHLLCINNFVYWFDICCLFAFAKFHLSEIHLSLRVLCQKSDWEVCLSVWQTCVKNWPEPLKVTGRLLLKCWNRASRWRPSLASWVLVHTHEKVGSCPRTLPHVDTLSANEWNLRSLLQEARLTL